LVTFSLKQQYQNYHFLQVVTLPGQEMFIFYDLTCASLTNYLKEQKEKPVSFFTCD